MDIVEKKLQTLGFRNAISSVNSFEELCREIVPAFLGSNRVERGGCNIKLQGDILALLVGLDRVCGEQSYIGRH